MLLSTAKKGESFCVVGMLSDYLNQCHKNIKIFLTLLGKMKPQMPKKSDAANTILTGLVCVLMKSPQTGIKISPNTAPESA